MSEQTVTENRKRSAGFPQLPLRESVEAIITIGQHGAKHSQDAAAAYLGHSTANSGAFRNKLAALRDWGLLARGDRDRVMLSDLAQNLVLQAPDHEDARDLLLAAFESCRVFGMLFHDSAKDTPLDMQRLRTVVVMRHGVTSEHADRFVDSFVESVVYARLGTFDGSRVTLHERDTAFAQASDERERVEEAPRTVAATTSEAARVASSASAMPEVTESATPVAVRQTWPIVGGEIEFIIRTSNPLPPTVYTLVAKMAEVAAEMQSKLSGPVVEVTTQPVVHHGAPAAEPNSN